VEDADGNIWITYDHNRANSLNQDTYGYILMARLKEVDAMQGRDVSGTVILRQVISCLTAKAPPTVGAAETYGIDDDRPVIATLPNGGIAYEDFIGTYTIWYHHNTTTPPPVGARGTPRRNRATVTLVPATPGQTYHLKGVLAPADEAQGNIVVHYNAKTGGIEIHGQQLFIRSGRGNAATTFWFFPEGITDETPARLARANINNAARLGVVSTNHDVLRGLRFEMVDRGGWGTNTTTGFRLVDFQGTRRGDDVNGAIGHARFSHIVFEKQR
jgi:hypothetical protein